MTPELEMFLRDGLKCVHPVVMETFDPITDRYRFFCGGCHRVAYIERWKIDLDLAPLLVWER